MPGIVYRALVRTAYDWGNLSINNSQVYTVAKNIDVSAYREATAIIRVHSLNITAATTPSVTVTVLPEGQTNEDPQLDFVASPASTTTIVLSNVAGLAPLLNLTALTTPFGGYLRVKVSGNQGPAQSTTFQVTLSIDIVAKS